MSNLNKYSLLHFCMGLYNDNTIDKVFASYQVAQLVTDTKFYPLENRSERGNSFEHFLQKLLEYSAGKFIANQYKNIKF